MSHPASPLSPNALTADTAPAAQTAVAAPADLASDLPREAMAAFVRTLAQWGNVRAAAAQVGVSRAHLYRMRRACPEFRTLWDAALVLARPQVEEVLADRALNGVQEVVYYHGEEVATRTRYDARLLLAHLARLDRMEEDRGVRMAAEAFDERLAELLDPPAIMDWDDEDYADDDNAGDYDDGDEGKADDNPADDDDAPFADEAAQEHGTAGPDAGLAGWAAWRGL